MPNNLQEDLDEILITGAGKTEVRTNLLSKGYNPDVVESELSQIPFANEKNNSSEDSKSGPKSNKVNRLATIGILVFIVGIPLKLFIFNQYRKKTYAQINVQICNTSKTLVVVETNLAKTLNSPYVNGGCLGTVIGELPTDYLYSEQLYIKISANGKSQTFHNGNFGSFTNMISRAQINRSPGEEGFFSNQEIQNVTYTITAEDVAECK